MRILNGILLGSILLYSCQKTLISDLDTTMDIPKGFPAISFPEGNEYTKARWELGKRLFYDPILSANHDLSCASCHRAQFAFSDTISLSIGDQGAIGKSNSPTLTNIAYQPYYTRAGGVPTLEMQIAVPIQEHDEFNSNILDIVERLKNDPSYVSQSKLAYDRDPDPYVLTRAISNFERSFISGNSNYDQYYYQNKEAALGEKERNGMNLFYSSKTNCSQCHGGFNFTNYAFENNGLYTNYKDSGRMRLTKLESDRARFKVPTLRNIELTAPYMHDGSMKSLEEVVNHYNLGGVSNSNKNSLIKPLGLSELEKQDLVAFLKSLTDFQFVNNKKFQK